MHCFDESSPVAAIGLGISDVVLCAQDEIAICAKVGFEIHIGRFSPCLRWVLISTHVTFCSCEVLSEKLLPGFEILDSA